jgi:Collagen triple helix repeat (20 copies)
MKGSLVTVVILLALFISGCNTSTAPQQGPPGQQGAQGQSGQQGQQGDQGQSGQQGYQGDQGQSGQQGQRGPGAPCPEGQHRYTDPATGAASCVRN